VTAMPRFAQRFVKDLRGVVAVEFALILPVMVVMLTGLAEVSNLMMAERRVSGAAHAVADLIAQETDVTNSDLDDIFQAAALIMEPFDSGDLTIGAVSVRYADADGTPFQDWSDAFNGGSVWLTATKFSAYAAKSSGRFLGCSLSISCTGISRIASASMTSSRTISVRPNAPPRPTRVYSGSR